MIRGIHCTRWVFRQWNLGRSINSEPVGTDYEKPEYELQGTTKKGVPLQRLQCLFFHKSNVIANCGRLRDLRLAFGIRGFPTAQSKLPFSHINYILPRTQNCFFTK
ncbi:hypothetical protein M378DRAFT_413953 [Amanita muscaria Koide BX008]|uniref:Uncharacterized protein n=1 Tax=Amanita muscaria (strain Koide BX008) TaxID=946122 RepID=A0A0C2XBR3_AMAMK|nr:hypothetical protein M378DRAFT_413953 [Amanita muscaria Koide BX008]